MKQLLSALFIIVLCSCNNKALLSPGKISELKTFFEANKKQADSTIIQVDSFRLVRIDTLTQKTKFLQQLGYFNAKVADKINETRLLIDLYKADQNVLNLSSEIVSSATYSFYKDKANDSKEKMSGAYDELKKMQAEAETAGVNVTKADSVKPIGYSAVCFYQIRKKDQSVEKDTTYIVLNLDKNAVDRRKFFGIE